jgi:hypothetical protein
MANKTVRFPYGLQGQTGLYAKVRQESTGYLLDNNDGVFKAIPSNPNIPLTEDSTFFESTYSFIENRVPWADGEYYAYAYDSLSFIVSVACFSVLDDEEVIRSVLHNNVRRTLGLIHENIFIDQTVYNSDNNLISARVRIYKTSGDVGTSNGVIGTYMITADPDGPVKFNFWKQEKL